ncbi:MAG: hypothetical protein JSS72_05415 [Armatimonadetes bacterium]|nr:hypothetical protein [Armatimonadota bacterium]
MLETKGHREAVTALAFSPDGDKLVSGDAAHDIVHDGHLRPIQKVVCKNPQSPIGPMRSLAFSHDGRSWFSATPTHIQKVDTETGATQWCYAPLTSLGVFHDAPMRIATSANGKLAVCFESGEMAIWSFDEDVPRRARANAKGHFLAWLGNDYVVSADGFEVQVTEATTGQRVRTWHLQERILGLSVEPERRLAAIRTLHQLDLIDLMNGAHLGSAPAGPGLPLVAFRPRSDFLASPGVDGVNLTTLSGMNVLNFPIRDTRATSIAFTGDGSRMAIGCADGSIHQILLPYVA